MSTVNPPAEEEPCYPIPNDENHIKFKKYKNEEDKLKNVKFICRLAEYKYYNMDQVVGNVLKIIEEQNI